MPPASLPQRLIRPPTKKSRTRLLKRLKLPINAEKTRCCRVLEESMTFLGYRIGRNYRRDTGRAYIGTRPSPASVHSICRRVSELTASRYGFWNPRSWWVASTGC